MEKRKLSKAVFAGLSLVLLSCSEDASTEKVRKSEDSHKTRAEGPETTESDSPPARQEPGSKPASGSNDSPEPSNSGRDAANDGAPNASSDPQKPSADPGADCTGFEVLGLKYSPGGTTLPNKCKPFDKVTNNPYAIRCIDADPEYKTNFAGDQFCILPPPPELGVQVHVGPENYDDPDDFVLAPGEDVTRSYYINSSNETEHYFYRTNYRARYGAHHVVISTYDADRADGWATDEMGSGGGSFADLSGVMSGDFGVMQRVDQDRPQGTLDVPEENVGLGALLKPERQFAFNLHNINVSEEPVLRELWLNIWYMEEKDVTTKVQPLFIMGSPSDVAIPAQQRTVLNYRCDIANDMRIITLYGHRHAQTERFGIRIEKASGETLTAYESFDWQDQPTYQYDSVSTNPKPNVERKIDGGSSGMLELTRGDKLFYTCDINNRLDVPLRFANEAIDGEMCIVFGSYAGSASPCAGGAQRMRD